MLENDQTESHENAPGHSDEGMEITADDNTKPADLGISSVEI